MQTKLCAGVRGSRPAQEFSLQADQAKSPLHKMIFHVQVLASPPPPPYRPIHFNEHLVTSKNPLLRCAEVSEQRSTSHNVSRGPDPHASSTPPLSPPLLPPSPGQPGVGGARGSLATGQRPLILWSVLWIELLGWGGGGEGGWNFIIILCWSLFWLSHLWVANWPNIWLHNSKGAE